MQANITELDEVNWPADDLEGEPDSPCEIEAFRESSNLLALLGLDFLGLPINEQKKKVRTDIELDSKLSQSYARLDRIYLLANFSKSNLIKLCYIYSKSGYCPAYGDCSENLLER